MLHHQYTEVQIVVKMGPAERRRIEESAHRHEDKKIVLRRGAYEQATKYRMVVVIKEG
jgi:hypothetical protein